MNPRTKPQQKRPFPYAIVILVAVAAVALSFSIYRTFGVETSAAELSKQVRVPSANSPTFGLPPGMTILKSGHQAAPSGTGKGS